MRPRIAFSVPVHAESEEEKLIKKIVRQGLAFKATVSSTCSESLTSLILTKGA